MALKDRIPENWKDDEKLTILQPVVIFKRLTNNKLKKYTKPKVNYMKFVIGISLKKGYKIKF